jgi:hypothetical protein
MISQLNSINKISVVPATLTMKDYLGTVKVRCGISRDNYSVKPGLYAVGNPDRDSDVFVTSNYKLSFDTLRQSLSGLNGYILVLDTNGINVWCAAGKGTFSTGELIKRIEQVSLSELVNHRRIIVPQLGATGVAGYKVKKSTGFNVHFGPVRAADIKAFISAGYRADKEMRKVKFGFKDRLVLIPNDFIYSKFYLLAAIGIVLIISGFSDGVYSVKNILHESWKVIMNVFLGYFAGIVITPFLLPFIPGRHFSLKGFFTGLITFLGLLAAGAAGKSIAEISSWFFIITTVSSFLAMNFTGSSTFTSLSGVKKEMKIFLPLQIAFASLGIILQVISKI